MLYMNYTNIFLKNTSAFGHTIYINVLLTSKSKAQLYETFNIKILFLICVYAIFVAKDNKPYSAKDKNFRII